METKKRRKNHVRRTPESYRKEVSEITGGEYSVLGDFVNTKTKILHQHLVCGTVWDVTPNNFINVGSRCPSCVFYRNLDKSHKAFVKKVDLIWGSEFTVLGKYLGVKEHIEVRHEECGEVLQVRPDSLLAGFGHASCSRTLEAVERAETLGFICDTIPKNLSDKVWLTHIVCGLKVHRNLRHVSTGYVGCSHCSGRSLRTPESYREEVAELTGEEYSVLGDFVDTKSKILHKHVECGHEWEIRPNHFLRGARCPNCVSSRGEKAVADVLDSLSIEYTREHTFEYLGRNRFDFFIPSLNIAIEYDGKQHFEAVDYWGGEETLKRTQESDALKNDFCEYMGIDLLRIPYWEFDNIDEIVTNFIDTVKLMRSISASGSEMSKCR